MKTNAKYDFGAYATRYNVKCADGRTLLNHAFDDDDGKIVPLIYNHDHDNPYAILGHALLEKREDGMYSYLSFNDTDLGKHCKGLIEHGDIEGVSIYANKLQQDSGKNVSHGVIRELSLVLAGANPGAFIDTVLAHHDDLEDATVSYNVGVEFETTSKEIETEEKEKEPEQEMKHSEEGESKMAEKTAGEVFEGIKSKLSDEEMNVIYGLIGMAAESAGEEGGEEMKHNAFEGDVQNTDEELIHSALHEIFVDAKKYGTLRDSYLAHSDEVQQYGIDHLEYFQAPEGTDIYNRPQFIKRQPDGWVSKVLNGVHHTPFSKVRMMFADITEDEARAKGYIKGNYKKEEFFKLQKRTISPTTIYKKQKFDRDDLADVDWDIIPWVKEEMGVMLNEEKARAYIFGDGRSNGDEDKINEANIIPVIHEESLFVDTYEVEPLAPSATKAEQDAYYENLIDQMVLAQDDYTGSGNLTSFWENKKVSRMLLLKDGFGHRLYKDLRELASAMGVSEIVKVPGAVIPAGYISVTLDLGDYNVGVKEMGKRSMFSDFDIDYNQMKYLIEERQSGCLIRPHSAIVLKDATNAG